MNKMAGQGTDERGSLTENSEEWFSSPPPSC